MLSIEDAVTIAKLRLEVATLKKGLQVLYLSTAVMYDYMAAWGHNEEFTNTCKNAAKEVRKWRTENLLS